ncbi:MULTISPECIES: hypothetical protein [unclassified Nocardioides]|uniref:hypothetical protein n=1 Tax=unclassified Nocardioides TaxID=2615069 RepID=UPI00070356A5|nr:MULTISPECIES: hypothetical protein [unclassified Nocardioides]KRC59598.1 hypothetical protein ASE19_00810 [Nocardioides sp. Root79]KRC68577.1 hypothetical protein ASE20_17150 [Nocardioides sp. Root240]
MISGSPRRLAFHIVVVLAAALVLWTGDPDRLMTVLAGVVIAFNLVGVVRELLPRSNPAAD